MRTLPFLTKCVDLENIMLNEINQRNQTDYTYIDMYNLTFMWNLKKK